MNKIINNMKITTLGACLTVALTTGVMSTTVSAANDSNEVRVAQAAKINVKQAIDIARKQASGTLISAEFDDDDSASQSGGGVYEIEFSTDSTKYELKVDAITGKIVKSETERLDSGDINNYKIQQQAKIKIMDAMSIAEKQTSGRVIEIEFENDRDYADHHTYYEIKVLKGNQIIELNVDADTGAVFNSKAKK